jgi:ribosomal small subunit protein bTHX
MGKGDIKTAKGKRVNGSYGNSRKRKTATPAVVAAAPKKEKKVAEKKETAEKKAPAAKKAAAPKAAAEKKAPAAKKATTKKDTTEK